MRVFQYRGAPGWTMTVDDANDRYRFDQRLPWQLDYQSCMGSLIDRWLRSPGIYHVTEITHMQLPEGL